ncbi:hypothetical protein NM688_g5055 [Phlebia brevispora]|uniref:Uncharacterized protein n=1 Tax=Phlebia brevispora TaxID=194682 RepID=A0ACC1T1C3_9APHY|nr:hypothetical protein NM688_g5055 [Phlebia brevispora]
MLSLETLTWAMSEILHVLQLPPRSAPAAIPLISPRRHREAISAAGCLDASMDNTSDHSIKTHADDTSHVMTSVSPVQIPTIPPPTEVASHHAQPSPYRLYKRRYIGLVALVVLNFVGGMSNPWFGPIASNMGRDFGFSLDKVNWLGNVINLTYLPFSFIIPFICTRWGLHITSYFGAFFLLISAWIRYAGTARSLTEHGAYGLIITGQILSGIAQPAFQVIGPLYSETWFDLKARTTVTMILSVANPIGGAIAQVISPAVNNTRTSILIMGIIATGASPFAIFVGRAPPTPPTHAAARKNPPFMALVRAMAGLEPPTSGSYMSPRERLDFAIITLIFGVLVGVVTSFTILTDQDFGPYGYSSDISGLMGAALLLCGLVAAAITSPLFDRVLTRHLAITCKILCPILGGMWLSLIWTGKSLCTDLSHPRTCSHTPPIPCI